MHRHYRRLVLRLYRKFRHPRLLKRNRFMRWFARHFLDKHVWRPTRHTFAGGLAVGLFCMLLVVPSQMAMAAVIAAILRLNIPIAMAVCWITNPVTMPAFAWWEIELGNWFIRTFSFGNPPPLDWHELRGMMELVNGTASLWEFILKLRPWIGSLYVGGVLLGLMLAPVGYALSYLFWDIALTITHRRIKEEAEDTVE
ncbi:MAG: DUF2062 domain-containing protein [Roseimicrobium sp.]